MVLASIQGVGDRLAQKITDHFGSEELALACLRSGDIARVAQIDGVSPKRALTMARSLVGDEGDFLATKEAKKLHNELLGAISRYTSSNAAKQRMQLLTPVIDSKDRRAKAQAAIDFVDTYPSLSEKLVNSFKGLSNCKTPQMRYDRVVVCHDEREDLKKWCRVLMPGESETWKDYKVFKTVTWIGKGGPAQAPDGWICLSSKPNEYVIIPEKTLDWFKHNRKTLNVICDIVEMDSEGVESHFFNDLKSAVSGLSRLPELMDELADDSDLQVISEVKDSLWSKAKELQEQVNQSVEAAMNDAKLALSGAELLEALSDGAAFQRKLKEATGHVIDEEMQKARDNMSEFLSATGIRCPTNLFTNDWPAKVDRSVLDSIDATLGGKLESDHADMMYQSARKLGPLMELCHAAISELIEFDQWLAVARWADENDAVMPEFVEDGIWVENGRHTLLGCKPTPVTYGLGDAAPIEDSQSIALLSGANSGGKTTLLELLAHTTILAHMGLPVPADRAKVGRVDALHILAKAGGTQSAGALEQTLVELAEVVSDPTPKLILADELEAITEPGAGARIIAGMLLAAEKQAKTSMMLVTHLAPAIIEASGRNDLRIDGIEAKGLDENLELIVDRTPRRNFLARSTPELIVKRLVQRSEGHAQALFAEILEMFSH